MDQHVCGIVYRQKSTKHPQRTKIQQLAEEIRELGLYIGKHDKVSGFAPSGSVEGLHRPQYAINIF